MLVTGYELDDYRITGILGVGGFGITYLAEDQTLRVRVAVKEFMPAHLATHDGTEIRPLEEERRPAFERELDNFLTEARNAARIQHPNVVRVRRCFRRNGTAYMVMDYEDGESFDEYLRKLDRPPTEETLKQFLRPFLDGLQAVHDTGLVHRDIKPSNIYLRRLDGSPVLIDFGAARPVQAAHFTAILTKGYAPIEQYEVEARQGPWTDIYGVAAVLYRAITGTKPLPSVSRMAYDNFKQARQIAKGYSETFLYGIDWGLAVQPDQRPQNVADWRVVLLDQPKTAPSSMLSGGTTPNRPSTVPIDPTTPTSPTSPTAPTGPTGLTGPTAFPSATLAGSETTPFVPEPAAAKPRAAPTAAELEEQDWLRARSDDTLVGYQRYLRVYPIGRYGDLAARAIEALQKLHEQEERTDPEAQRAAVLQTLIAPSIPPQAAAAPMPRTTIEVLGRTYQLGPVETETTNVGFWQFLRPSQQEMIVLGFLGLIVTIIASIMLRGMIGTNVFTLVGCTLITFSAAFAYTQASRETNLFSGVVVSAITAVGSLVAFLLLVLTT